jgi:hypothetical protein
MSKTIFCIAPTEFQAESVLNELRVAGLPDRSFSILLGDKTRAMVRGITGTIGTDSAVGWLPQIESIVISGVGAFIASGLLATAIGEAAAGSHKGAVARGLTGLGLASEQSETLEEKLRAGKVLLAIETENDDQAKTVIAILQQSGAEDIITTSEPARLEAAPRIREEKWEKW